jgi:F-type H+-transporting ATPase subunit b|tara:strand:- start:457 stop:1050 length:594 start_codon:yes stop_codon:yes gene_type:complete
MLKKLFFLNSFILLSFVSIARGASESSGMPQLDPEFWFSQVFWLILTFGGMYFILSKFILPKISQNIETRKSQILENIEIAEKQRKDSESKLKEFDEIILNSKLEAIKIFNDVKKNITNEINKKKESLEKDLDQEVILVEKEINDLKKNSINKINLIAVETSIDLIKHIMGEEINKSSISAIVDDIAKKDKEKYYGV